MRELFTLEWLTWEALTLVGMEHLAQAGLIERRRVLGPVAVVLQGVGVAVSKLFVWR
jgi:hypothetical protein